MVPTSLSLSQLQIICMVLAVRLWDKDVITGPWVGGYGNGSPGAGGKPLESTPIRTASSNPSEAGLLKPDRSEWRGRRNLGGLGLSLKDVMSTMVDLFSAQM